MEELGERIREARTRLNLPRAEFALLIGISTTTLFNYEAGDREPNADVLMRICEEAEVNPIWLLSGYGPQFKNDNQGFYKQISIKIINKISEILSINISKENSLILEDSIKNIILSSIYGINSPSSTEEKDEIEDITKENIMGANGEKEVKHNNKQIAKGSNNIQVGGNVSGGISIKTVTPKVNLSIQPPDGSIGANAMLTERITGLFNELGKRREERFGKTAYPVMYNEFKKEFSIPKNQKYTTYLLWPEARSSEIIEYLENKLSNTIKGRTIRAFDKKGHDRRYILAETGRLPKILGWTDEEYRMHLKYLFGVTSRADLNQSQLANYVEYLRQKIDEI